jgi:hypothetical protein
VYSGALKGVPKVSGEQEEFEVMIANGKISIKSYLDKFLTVPRSADRCFALPCPFVTLHTHTDTRATSL